MVGLEVVVVVVVVEVLGLAGQRMTRLWQAGPGWARLGQARLDQSNRQPADLSQPDRTDWDSWES